MLYKDKYRVPSIRLKNWDYRSAGYYFITICTNNRWKEPFGQIKGNFICLSNIGTIAYQYWNTIPKHFPNVALDTFIVMPDHIHGIIIITSDNVNDPGRDVACNVSTTHAKIGTRSFFRKISPSVGSLSSVIRSYKSAVTRRHHKNNLSPFQWQSRYYERIIRSERELQAVRKYIRDNPKHYK